MTEMWLLIDDERSLDTEAVARTAEAGRKLLALGGWNCVCFGHDLGVGRWRGYDVLMWGLENDFLPCRVQIVTANPGGRQNMRDALEAFGYTTTDGYNFALLSRPRGMDHPAKKQFTPDMGWSEQL